MTYPNEHRRRLPGKVLLVSAVAAVALGGWLGWGTWAARAADQVSASWSLDCGGTTTVGEYQGDPAIRSRRGWACDVVLQIVNAGNRTVHVTGVEAPLMGTAGGAEVQAGSSKDAAIRDASAGPAGGSRFGDVDAVWDVHTAIPPGSSRTLHLPIGWRESGCNAGGHLYLERWPTVVFEALRRTHRYSPPQRLVLRTYDDRHDARACPR